MRFGKLSPLLLVLLALCLHACKDDEDEAAVLTCDDVLVTNPIYAEGMLQMNFGGEAVTDTNYNQTYSYTPNPQDSNGHFVVSIFWHRQNNVALSDVYTQLFFQVEVRLPNGAEPTPQDVFLALSPHQLLAPSTISFVEFMDFIISIPNSGATLYDMYYTDPDALDNQIAITSRSPMFQHPGGFLATRIEGTFCCNVYHTDTQQRKTIQGNFSGVARLE